MINFSNRLRLQELYYDWINDVVKEDDIRPADCPQNVITFLQINNLLDETAISKFLEVNKDKPSQFSPS